MSILQAVEKHENLISRIKETIVPLQTNKRWNDDKFLKEVEDCLTAGILYEETVSKIVADALFNLKISKPEVEDVKKLIAAFPKALTYKNSKDRLPIEKLTFYTPEEEEGKYGTKYISTLALEGLKHNVGGENMRGGLLRVDSTDGMNTLQRLAQCRFDDRYLEPLKDLRNHKLVIKKDIVDYNLLYHSCIGKESLKRFQYFIEWDHEALIKTIVNRVPLIHAIIKSKEKRWTLSNTESFKRFLKYSLPHYKRLFLVLFLEDIYNRTETTLDQALKKFGERKTMTILREVFGEKASYPLLHQVIVNQPKHYSLPAMVSIRVSST